MDEILRRYHAAVKDITSRPYDYLNHRMLGFDPHMAEFEARLNDLKLFFKNGAEKENSALPFHRKNAPKTK
jgi:hypothetical protein